MKNKDEKKGNKLRKKIEKQFLSCNINVKLKLKKIIPGFERYIFRIKLRPGVKVSEILARADDIKFVLRLSLFVPFIRGTDIFLAVSKNKEQQNSLIDMLNSKDFRDNDAPLLFALGYDPACQMVFDDLAKQPHILYGGPTFSGKSFAQRNLCLSIAVKNTPNEVSIIIIDTGARTMNVFQDLPHLAHPIVKDPKTGLYVLKKLIKEMERRNSLDDEELAKLPKIVCIIDEFLSLVKNIDNKKLERQLVHCILELLQRCRHNGIHMVLSAQDSAIKSTGVKLDNITARAAFPCAKYNQSVTILGCGGAEKLTEQGEMIYMSRKHPECIRLQGAYMGESEAEELVERIKSATSDVSNKFVIPERTDTEPSMIDEILNSIPPKDKERDEKLADIVVWTLARDKVSARDIMKRYKMGNRAYGIVDSLCEMGIVSKQFANQPRDVLVNTITELSEDVVDFVGEYGYTTEQIAEILARKSRSASSGNQPIEADSQDMPECDQPCEEEGDLE